MPSRHTGYESLQALFAPLYSSGAIKESTEHDLLQYFRSCPNVKVDQYQVAVVDPHAVDAAALTTSGVKDSLAICARGTDADGRTVLYLCHNSHSRGRENVELALKVLCLDHRCDPADVRIALVGGRACALDAHGLPVGEPHYAKLLHSLASYPQVEAVRIPAQAWHRGKDAQDQAPSAAVVLNEWGTWWCQDDGNLPREGLDLSARYRWVRALTDSQSEAVRKMCWSGYLPPPETTRPGCPAPIRPTGYEKLRAEFAPLFTSGAIADASVHKLWDYFRSYPNIDVNRYGVVVVDPHDRATWALTTSDVAAGLAICGRGVNPDGSTVLYLCHTATDDGHASIELALKVLCQEHHCDRAAVQITLVGGMGCELNADDVPVDKRGVPLRALAWEPLLRSLPLYPQVKGIRMPTQERHDDEAAQKAAPSAAVVLTATGTSWCPNFGNLPRDGKKLNANSRRVYSPGEGEWQTGRVMHRPAELLDMVARLAGMAQASPSHVERL